MLHSAIRATLWREWMSSQRIWLQQPVTADLKLFPDVKWADVCCGSKRELVPSRGPSAYFSEADVSRHDAQVRDGPIPDSVNAKGSLFDHLAGAANPQGASQSTQGGLRRLRRRDTSCRPRSISIQMIVRGTATATCLESPTVSCPTR